MLSVRSFLLAACCLTTMSMSQSSCYYHQRAVIGTEYYVHSPNYPAFYPPGTNCQWYIESPTGTSIILNCYEVRIPQSLGCRGDHLAVSPNGIGLSDAHRYCGVGDFLVESEGNRLDVSLSATIFSRGGRFVCVVKASLKKPNCDCGWNQKPRIVGGTETSPNEYPMMAALVDGTLRILYCGSTIISSRYVLTAAHCVTDRTPSLVGVLVGEHDTRLGNETTATNLILSENFTAHPDYDAKTQLNDIALVRVSKDIVFSNKVGPACLPIRFYTDSFQNQLVTVLGWGTTDFGGPLSPFLQQVRLRVIDRQECAAKLHSNIIIGSQMCTYTVNQDACQSDSGGPVLWQDPATGRLHLVGIISYGVGCASELPGVNTRVGAYLDWIIKETKSDNYCVK